MENITFAPIKKRSRAARLALPLWLAFRAEIKGNGDENPVEPLPDFRRRVNNQGSRPDMHFDLVRAGKKKTPIGFAHYAIDLGTVGGLIAPGGGVFLAYYIAPAYRRKGYGKRVFLHCAETLSRDGAAYLYCCPDPVTGEPFWRAMGFEDSGILDPDDKLNIYMLKKPNPADITCRAMIAADLHVNMMDGFERYQEITRIVRKNGRVKKLRKPRVEDMTGGEKEGFIKHLFIPAANIRQFYPNHPPVFAAFRGDQVVGFAKWRWIKDQKLKRSKEKEFAILDLLFISRECRRMGLGRQLFNLCAQAAKAEGAPMLYISTNPAMETQAFYKSMGCVKTKTDLGRVTRASKHDIPLEYPLILP
ncbi:MAG: GNAT family N-acetyltransferase [Firmicutes bacterium]|nr:GNAT family N-acetyltransferase [Bacillota bacterium]